MQLPWISRELAWEISWDSRGAIAGILACRMGLPWELSQGALVELPGVLSFLVALYTKKTDRSKTN